MAEENTKISDKEPVPTEKKRRRADKSSHSTEFTYNDYTVGWVCALPKEQTAATAMLDKIHSDLPKPPNDHNTYTLGSIGKHNIVVACLPKGMYGTNSAATVATRMVGTFSSIKIGLMVGIGGGIPPKVRLGDVVVSAPVDQYPGVVQWDFGKTEKDGNFKRTGALNNSPSALLTALTKLETEHEMNGSKIYQYLDDLENNWPKLAAKYSWSASLKDPLIAPDNFHYSQKRWDIVFSTFWMPILALIQYLVGWWVFTPVRHGAEQVTSTTAASTEVDRAKRKPGDMHVHYGLIASGNQVIKDAKSRDSLNESLGGNVLCVEMEAAGLMNDFPCIVIRGICDYADSNKTKDWQEHAAAVAGAFAKELLEYVQPSDIDRERPVKDILDQVLDTVSRTEASFETIRFKLDRKEDLEILDWLTDIDYGPQQTDYIRSRQAGTGQWLLDSVEYQAWLKTSKQTLFCPGIPGAGKTICTSIVVYDLITRFRNDPSTGIVYIYCNFRRQNEQKIDNLLASLVKQLAESQPFLPESVKDLYDHHKVKRTRPSTEEILRVLQSLAAMYSRVFFLVDALDECQVSDGCRARFLSELFSLQIRYRANVFATSRFIPEITDHFKTSLSLKIRASTDDVARYLERHIEELPSFVQQNQQLQEEIKTGILEAVDGMFLLAKIYLSLLDDKLTLNDIRSTLEVFQKQGQGSDEDQKVQVLDHAYKQAIERINGQKPGLKNLAMKVLSWITCAERPLTKSELQHALATKVGKFELDQGDILHIGDIVSVCLGLVTVDEESNIVRLVHYTTQEYFERTQDQWFPNADIDITTTCITYLSFRVFDSGYCLTDAEFEERLQLNQLYSYAARNWGHHACKALALCQQVVCQQVVKFLECEPKIEAASQALLASKTFSLHSGYSHDILGQLSGINLLAYFGLKEVIMTLIENGHNLDSKDSSGCTPLLWAVRCGHEAVVNLLLENGADPETKDKDGCTPLLCATWHGYEAVVKLLLEKGAELETKNEDGRTPLLCATWHGYEAVVKLLLEKGAELETKDQYGRTPLLCAIWHEYEAVVKLLLEKGAKLETKDQYGRTPLLCAIWHECEAVVKLLLEKGAELETKDQYGRTPLFCTVSHGYEAVVKLLLEKGAELETKDKDGRTPLLCAASHGYEAVVKLLLEKGAELETKDEDGRRPLFCAISYGHKAVVKLLLEKGAELETKDEDGRTPLFCAVSHGHEEVVQQLLAIDGINPDLRDRFGQTPLLLAAGNGHVAVVKILLAKDVVDLNSKDNFGRTPLSWAARRGHSNVVKLLLQNDKADSTAICSEDVHIATLRAVDQPARILCDICMSGIPDIDVHHHCKTCRNGDFDICEECISSGAFCPDRSHKLYKGTVKSGNIVELPDC